jgi:sugar phosphate isomerase/epimerase
LKIGIIQARLTTPDEGHQTTPIEWKREFDSLSELGLNHIEWNLDKNKLHDNPIFKAKIDSKTSSLISSVCFDNLVSEKTYEEGFFQDNFTIFLDSIEKAGVHSVTLPLLEVSGITSKKRLEKMKALLLPVIESHKNMNFNIESDSNPENVREILDLSDRLKFTYDTGNITAANYDHKKYISVVFDKISNVHLKDRKKSGGQSMLDFSGDTDFKNIFSILSSLGYDELFTLQMARGEPGLEISLNRRYLNFFRKEYDKHF